MLTLFRNYDVLLRCLLFITDIRSFRRSCVPLRRRMTLKYRTWITMSQFINLTHKARHQNIVGTSSCTIPFFLMSRGSPLGDREDSGRVCGARLAIRYRSATLGGRPVLFTRPKSRVIAVNATSSCCVCFRGPPVTTRRRSHWRCRRHSSPQITHAARKTQTYLFVRGNKQVLNRCRKLTATSFIFKACDVDYENILGTQIKQVNKL